MAGSPASLGFAHFATSILTPIQSSVTVPRVGLSKKSTVGGAQKEVYTFTNVRIPTLEGGANGAQGSLKLADLTKGNTAFQSVVVDLTVVKEGTGITATAAVVGSIGTAPAGVDATLTATEANLVASTAATLTAGVGVFKGVNSAVVVLNGTVTANSIFLNFAMNDAGSTASDALLVSGTVTVNYVN